MKITAEKVRFYSRWVTIGLSCLSILCGVAFASSSLGIDFEVEIRTHEHDRLDHDVRQRDNERSYDRVQEYHRDPSSHDKPSRDDYRRSYDYFMDNLSKLMEQMHFFLEMCSEMET
jgi:hypothetical protein